MHAEYEAFPRGTWAAMQAARTGQWIEDTEEPVREAGEAFRRKALGKLLPAQVEEGQAAFSPWRVRDISGGVFRPRSGPCGAG